MYFSQPTMIRFLFVLNFFFTLKACAQTKGVVKRVCSFVSVRIMGEIPVDEKGRALTHGVDSFFIVYVETGSKAPEWKKVWRNNKTYTVHPKKMNEVVQLDLLSENGERKQVKLAPGQGHQIWQLTLEPTEESRPMPMKIKGEEMLLEGLYQKKPFFQKVGKPTRLWRPDSV